MRPAKIGCWNVMGLKLPKSSILAEGIINSLNLDLIFLLETNMTKDSDYANRLRKWTNNLYRVDSGAGKGTGVSLVTRHPDRISKIKKDPEGRWMKIRLRLGNKSLALKAIYAPSNQTENKKWYEESLNNPTEKLDILLGDFNTDLDKNLPPQLSALITYNHMTRVSSPLGEHTWEDSRGHKSLIDGIYIRTNLLQITSSPQAHFTPKSDHQVLFMELRPIRTEWKKQAPWRLRETLATDPKAINAINDVLNEFARNNGGTLDEWLRLKHRIRQEYINISKRTNQGDSSDQHLRKLIMKYNKQRKTSGNSRTTANLEQEIIKAAKERAETKKIKNFEGWNSWSELPTPQLSRLLRDGRVNSEVLAIRHPKTGDIKENIPDLLEAFHTYYQELFDRQETDEKDHAKLLKRWAINTELITRMNLDQEISEKEVLEAITNTNPRKAPGPDGLSGFFYKIHKKTLVPILTRIFNKTLEEGTIPCKFKSGITTTIFKKGDPLEIGNRRPITLLNIDYKILSKVLSYRLKKILPQIVHPHQTGFVPGRFIIDNVLVVATLLDHLKYGYNEDATIMLHDIGKAFDSVSHDAILRTLHHIHLPNKITRLIYSMLTGSTTRIMVNGFLTNKVKIRRGTKQGDPLSPILFVLAIEPLLRTVEGYSRIEGLNIPGSQHFLKALMFADDTVTFAKNAKDRRILQNILECVKKGIGLTMNPQKTVVFASHSSHRKLRLPKDYKILNPDEPTRYLGFKISLEEGIQARFQELVEDCRKQCGKWKNICKTPHGRANILNAYINSKFTLQSYLEPSPSIESTEPQLIKLFNWFIWGYDTDISSKPTTKMKLERIMQPKQHGGLSLRLPSIQAFALKTNYLNRLLKTPESPAHKVLEAYLNIRRRLEQISSSPLIAPPFYILKSIHDIYSTAIKSEPGDSSKALYWNAWKARYGKDPIYSKKQEEEMKQFKDPTALWMSVHHIRIKKHRSLIWRYLQKALPIPKTPPYNMCPDCDEVESHNHCLFGCPRTLKIIQEINPIALDVTGHPLPEWTQNQILTSNLHSHPEITAALWTIWYCRNRSRHGESTPESLVEAIYVRELAKSFNALPKKLQKRFASWGDSSYLQFKEGLALIR